MNTPIITAERLRQRADALHRCLVHLSEQLEPLGREGANHGLPALEADMDFSFPIPEFAPFRTMPSIDNARADGLKAIADVDLNRLVHAPPSI